jgi:hypothetical protein
MRRAHLILVALAVALAVAPSHAAQPGKGAVSLARPTARWSGGPMNGNQVTGILVEQIQDLCNPGVCDDFKLTISVPLAYWKRAFGGVAIRVDWDSMDNDFDLYVFNNAGDPVASSVQGNTTSEATFLFAPNPGAYTVRVIAFNTNNARYRARASIVQERGSKA